VAIAMGVQKKRSKLRETGEETPYQCTQKIGLFSESKLKRILDFYIAKIR
jgi:hypothetical protein